MASSDESHADRQRRYEAVIGTIRHNTGGPSQPSPQPPGLKIAHIRGNRSRAGYERRDTERALRAAVENGDVLRFRDAEGSPRYAVNDQPGLRAVIAVHGLETVLDARGLLERIDDVSESGLRDLVEREAAADSPNRDVIAACNQLLSAMPEDDDE